MVNQPIPRFYPVVKNDRISYFLRNIQDCQINCIIAFEQQLNKKRLEKAIRLSLDAEPILGCCFVDRYWRLYWERRDDLNSLCQCDLEEASKDGKELIRYISTPIDHLHDPLVQVKIFRAKGDTLCLKINHLVADAAGVKEYAYLLSSIYRNLQANPQYTPPINLGGTRHSKQFMRSFHWLDRIKMLRRSLRDWKNEYCPPQNWSVHLNLNPPSRPTFAIRRIEPQQFHVIKEVGKNFKATVNDIMVAAFFRSLHKIIRPDNGVPLRLGATVDLRRYMPNGKGKAICNLVGFLKVNIGDKVGISFTETILLVRDQMNEFKKDYLGLGDCRFFMFNFTLPPYLWSQWLCRKWIKFSQIVGARDIPPGLTNMGNISNKLLDFGEVEVKDAFLTPPIAFPPLFMIGLSGFSESLTMSIGFCRSAIDKEIVERILDHVVDEISLLGVCRT